MLLRKRKLKKMASSEFMGLKEVSSFQYLTNIFPSPYLSPPRGEARVSETFHGLHGKEMLTPTKLNLTTGNCER
jgi:hypothetical protein